MSTDYFMRCPSHRLSHYLGFRSTARFSFGYGKDDDEGRLESARFLLEHVECPSGLKIVSSHSEELEDDFDGEVERAISLPPKTRP